MVLKDRVALVTGGSSGIGRSIAIEFAREGAKVAVVDLQEEPKQGKYHETDVTTPTVAKMAEFGGEGMFVTADVSRESDVRQMVQQVVNRFGGLDILVNNAGIFIPGNSQDLSLDDWDRTVRVVLRSAFLTVRYAVPHLKESRAGRIINIASIHAFGGGGGPAYPPAKAGVVNLTRDAAVELAGEGVTANVICPGYIETAIQDYLTPEQIEACRQRTPLSRLGKPRDIARACVFFASDDAEWITGVVLPVDGGWMAPIL